MIQKSRLSLGSGGLAESLFWSLGGWLVWPKDKPPRKMVITRIVTGGTRRRREKAICE
jgi:hypothetical protein